MVDQRVLAKRLELLDERMARRHRERRRDADVLQAATIVEQPEQQRADGVSSALVPAKSGDDAVSRARVLDLDHRADAGLIARAFRFGDDAVQARALESRQP